MKTLQGVIEHEILQHYIQLPETTNPLKMEDNYKCAQGHAPLINYTEINHPKLWYASSYYRRLP